MALLRPIYYSKDYKLKSFTINGLTYSNIYEPNGNLTKEGESRYFDWGANDKLSVFKNQAGSSTPSVYTNYFYNAQGERVKKHTRKGNKIVVTLYMDGGMFETSYTKTVGGEIDNDLYYNTIKISDDSALIATIKIGKNVDNSTPDIQYVIGDHLNNSSVVLTITGTLINREEYYPFGETSFGSFKFKRYRYNGKEKDEESGLYEYGQRYYAPWLCRFVSVDPVAEKFADLSSYNYAGNKPISKVDLEGLQEEGRENTPQNAKGAQNQELQKDFSKDVWNQKALEAAPKEDVSNWEDLINYKPDQVLVNTADKRVSPNKKGGVSLQDIESASGSLNVDFYSITVSQFPEGITPEQFLEHFRTNLNDFLADGGTTFEPYSTQEGEKFQSNNPDGALMRFEVYLIGVNVDDLSVIASNTNSSHWIFSPVTTPEDWGHPVAGNRQFGMTANEDGTHTFYIRGADRPWSWVDALAENKVFEGADKLWKAAINNATNYINNKGGKATIQSTFSKQIK